jgi:hypothetical protein
VADVLGQIREAVETLNLAKSRRTNSLSDKEKADLLSSLEEIIKPLLEQEQEQPPVQNGNGKEPQWVGTSEGDGLEITADKKSEVLDAWIENFSLDPDKVLSTKVGYAYFYVYPLPDNTTHELWVRKAALSRRGNGLGLTTPAR